MKFKMPDILRKPLSYLGQIKPLGAFCFFVGLIIVYGTIYSFTRSIFPSGSAIADTSWYDGIYFSVVTITTLGYGDIVPGAGLGRFLVTTEALFGVIVLGLFLNALWQAHLDTINQANIRANEAALRAESTRRLKIYLGYFKSVLDRYAAAQAAISTDPQNRTVPGFQTSFSFNDLQWIYLPPLNVTHDLSSTAIEVYFTRLDAVCAEIKYVLANFDIYHMEQLHRDLVDFLILVDKMDCRGSLLGNRNLGSGSNSVSKLALEQIKTLPPQPDPAQYPSNIVLPYILFYYALHDKTKILLRIAEAIDSILSKSNQGH